MSPARTPAIFVRSDRRSHAATADGHSALDLPVRDGPGERDDEIGVIIAGILYVCTEIHDFVSRTTQRLSQLRFQGKSSMVGGNSYSHHARHLCFRSM